LRARAHLGSGRFYLFRDVSPSAGCDGGEEFFRFFCDGLWPTPFVEPMPRGFFSLSTGSVQPPNGSFRLIDNLSISRG
jgi:hypothetical protein